MKKPEITYFIIFGFCAWTRIPYDRRKSMEAQSKEYFFVGYPEGLMV
jgi:hypothetical protein